jgi:uncharacterized protein YjiS (DUF1127 family)
MALSLPGERSITAATPPSFLSAFYAWFAAARRNRARRNALQGLLELDSARLHDLGLNRSDIHDAISAGQARASVKILDDARALSARR